MVLLAIDVLLHLGLALFLLGVPILGMTVGFCLLSLWATRRVVRRRQVLAVGITLALVSAASLPFLALPVSQTLYPLDQRKHFDLPYDPAISRVNLTVQGGIISVTSMTSNTHLVATIVEAFGRGNPFTVFSAVRWTTTVVGSRADVEVAATPDPLNAQYGAVGYATRVFINRNVTLDVSISSSLSSTGIVLDSGASVGRIVVRGATTDFHLVLTEVVLSADSRIDIQTEGDIGIYIQEPHGPEAVIPVVAHTSGSQAWIDAQLDLDRFTGARGSASATPYNVHLDGQYLGDGASFETLNIEGAITILELSLVAPQGSVELLLWSG